MDCLAESCLLQERLTNCLRSAYARLHRLSKRIVMVLYTCTAGLHLCLTLCMVLQAEGRRNDSGPASPSGRGQERQLRVHGHSKLVKEFTDLCIVQELNAHNGESQGWLTRSLPMPH